MNEKQYQSEINFDKKCLSHKACILKNLLFTLYNFKKRKVKNGEA